MNDISHENLPHPENLPISGVVFEHLFPGNKWNKLARLNPLNIPGLVDYWVQTEPDAELGRAFDAGKGFASRIDVPRPDQAILGYLLQWTAPVNEKVNRALIDDFMETDERIGGVALQNATWRDPMYFMKVLDRGMSAAGPFLRSTNAYLLGILNPEGQPSALIKMIKGERDRNYRGGKKRIILATSKLASKEVGVEI